MLIIGPKNPTCNNLEHYLTLDGCSVNSSSSSDRNLGVLFDSNLSFESHVSSICKPAFFHLKNISKLRPMLSTSNAEMLIHAFMTSRLHCKTFRCKFTIKYWQLGCQPLTVFLQDYYCKQHLQFCTVFTKYSIILLYNIFLQY